MIFFFNEGLKAKFIGQPCGLPVACPAALCELCQQFVCLWPVHQLNFYDFQRPGKQHHPRGKINAHLASTPKPLWAKYRGLQASCSQCQEYLVSFFARNSVHDIYSRTSLQRLTIFIQVVRFVFSL